MKAKYIFIAALAAVAMLNTSCEKVSPQGVLMGNTAVEDRVEMSYRYFQENNLEQKFDYDLVDFTKDGYSWSRQSCHHRLGTHERDVPNRF